MTTQGLASWTAKIARIPQLLRDSQRQADDKNADDFMQQVAVRVPKADGPSDGEHYEKLVDTLQKTPGPGPMAVSVSIGGPRAPFPAHLEFGHMSRGGRHVPAEPFWYPTLRVNRTRFRSRRSRAASAALKTIASPAGADG